MACDHIPRIYGDYCAYEHAFIKDRFQDILKVYNALDHGLTAVGIEGFDIHQSTVWQVCYIYANDLKPIRQFHNIDGCDCARRAALVSRLISKFRPIRVAELNLIPDTAERQGAHYLHLNEILAVEVLEHFLDLHENVFSIQSVKKIQDDLLFIFTFRDPMVESLVSLARALKTISDLVDALHFQGGINAVDLDSLGNASASDGD